MELHSIVYYISRGICQNPLSQFSTVLRKQQFKIWGDFNSLQSRNKSSHNYHISLSHKVQYNYIICKAELALAIKFWRKMNFSKIAASGRQQYACSSRQHASQKAVAAAMVQWAHRHCPARTCYPTFVTFWLTTQHPSAQISLCQNMLPAIRLLWLPHFVFLLISYCIPEHHNLH